MNPQQPEAPSMDTGMNLPPPVGDNFPLPGAPERPSGTPEQAPAGAERAPAAGQVAASSMAQPALPATPLAPPVGRQDDVSATTNPLPQSASADQDLIEKEWVTKAKQIVEHNRDDPYKQSEELTVVKADYMKKRYGKNIKVSK
jgi:hypothetical protein